MLSLLFAASLVSHQTPSPSDVDTEDHLLAALYDVISGPAGKERDWNRMRSLFAKDASMAVAFERQNGEVRDFEFNVEKYIQLSGPELLKKGFYEHEIGRRSERFGHIEQVFSSYESRYDPKDPKPFERGVNALQLFFDGKRWWIRTIIWEGETPKLKLPGSLLRRSEVH
ncbi:MAG TPA: hypothetical protein VG944_11105 [Fimbriimonas sp.]|nr:hypothetical protein [Fimbriimonas sp.]